MQSSFLLAGLETRYPALISARIVAALRQDNLVWSALEDEELYQRMMEAERGNPLFWTPANLGLILLGTDLKSEVLASSHFPGIDSGLRQQAMRAYEDVIRRGTPPAHLRDAVLIALALRERRKTTGSWNGLANELLYNGALGKPATSRMWKTALAVVWGLTPDPDDLLTALIKCKGNRTPLEWALHCIITVPFEDGEVARRLAHLMQEAPVGKQVDMLKMLRAHGMGDLAARTTNLVLNGHPLFSNFKMKTDLDQATPENLAGRILTLQQLAAFNQLAGSPAQAEACLRMARSVAEYWQSGLDLQLLGVKAEINQDNLAQNEVIAGMLKTPLSKRLTEELSPVLLGKSADLAAGGWGSSAPEHPMVLLSRALLCHHEGDCDIARELGIRASTVFLEYIRENERPFIGDFMMSWNPVDFLNGVLELGLVEEAEICAEAILENQPTDTVLLTMHADLLLKRGKYRKARSTMRLAVALLPDCVELRRKLAETDERGGDWDDAYLHRKTILDYGEGENIEDKLAYARAAFRAGKVDQVIAICNAVLQMDPDQAGAHGWLGLAMENQKQYEDAAAHLTKATLLAPEQSDWWLALAALHRGKGDRKSAYDCLRAAVMAAPEAGSVYFGLGEMLLEDGLSSEALPHLRRAGELLPGDENISLRLSKALHHLGHLSEARFVVEKMRGKWSQQPELAYEFASLAYEQGDLEGAIPAFEAAVRSEQPKAEWMVMYAGMLLDDQLAQAMDAPRGSIRYSQAESLLQKALNAQPDDLDARIMMADALRKQGAYDKALTMYQALAEIPGNIQPEQLWKVQHGLGLTALELNLVEPALASLRDAASHQPGNLALQRDMVRAYLAAHLPKEAAQVAENVLDQSVQDAAILRWYADVMINAGRADKARESLHTAVELDPDNPDLLLQLADIQLQLGDIEGMRQTLNTLTANDRAPVDALRKAAQIFMRVEDAQSALACLERAAQSVLQPDAGLLYDLARLYDQAGDPGEALAVMQGAIDDSVKDARVYVYYADLLARCAQEPLAQSVLEKALVLAQIEPADRKAALEAQIYRMLADGMLQAGSMPAALLNAQKALERSPDDVNLRIQAGALSLGLLKFDAACKAGSVRIEDGMKTFHRVPRLALIAAEANLECGNLVEAINAWEECVGAPDNKAWQMAVESRLDARGGDWVRAEEMARKALECALDTALDEGPAVIWAGKAAIEAGLWDEGLGALEKYHQDHIADPLAAFELGKALVLTAERELDCQEIDCVRHAPGEQSLSENAYNRAKSLLEQAFLATQSAEAMRWMARAEVAFHPSVPSIKELGRIANMALDTAAVVRALRNGGNWPAAALAGQQAPDSIDVKFQLGLGYLDEDPQQGYEAVVALREVMQRMPMLYVLESMLAEKSNHLSEAAQAMQDALAIWPDEPVWQGRAAQLAELNGDAIKAVHFWKAAATLSPETSSYPMALGKGYMHLGRYREAVEAFDQAAQISPTQYEAWMNLAKAAQKTGNLTEAMDAVRQATVLREEETGGLLLASEIALDLGNTQDAAEYARKALRLEPNNPDAVLLLANALTKEGKEEEGLALIEGKLGDVPSSLPLLFERTRLVYKLKGAPAASGLAAKLAQTHPEDTAVQAMMARIQVESGDKNGAERSALKSLRLNPEQPELSLILGKLEREMGQLDQAVHFLSETIRMEPKNVDAYLELGKTYLDRREHGAALDTYRHLIHAVPDDKRGYYEAALISKESKDYVAAERMLQQAAKLDPEDLQIRRQLIAVMALNLIHKSQEAVTSK